jgi:hypothetical protein
MMKTFLAGAAVIGLAGIAILVALYVATQAPPSAPNDGPAASVTVPPAPDAPAPALAYERPAPLPAQAPPRPPDLVGPKRLTPQAGSWESVAVAARARELGPLGAAVMRGLNDLQPQLAGCFDEVTEARFARESVTPTRDAEPMQDQGATIFVLLLESGGGMVRIVDAPVETQGAAGDGVVVCAQRLLRGRSFAVPTTPADGRHRLIFQLTR